MQNTLWMGWVALPLLAVGLVAPRPEAAAYPAPPAEIAGDEADAAEKLAIEADKRIRARVGDEKPYRVAIFPLGNSQGQMSYDLAGTLLNLQGELIEKLMPLASGRYFVVDQAGLSRLFTDAGADASGISTANPEATARVLRRLKVQAAIVGSLNGPSRTHLVSAGKAAVTASIIYADGGFDQLTGSFDAGVVPPPLEPSGRFNVEILSGGRVLPLKRAEARSGAGIDVPYYHAVFLILDKREMMGQEYKIRISNLGKPYLRSLRNAREADARRQFAAVVKVDGVNSLYQKNGSGKMGPVVVHPKNARRWILTPPGYAYFDKGGLVMEPYTPDGATITIPGFQVSPDANKAFTFTGASDSIAETVGITSSVGLIEVHFYPQRLKEEPETRPGKIMDLDPPAFTVRPSPPDTKTRPAEPEIAGTKPGTQRTFKTRNVVLEWEDKPVEVWYIFYRYGSPGLSPGYQLVPFVPTTN